MANGSSFASLSLDRRAKRGRVGTAGGDMPAPAGAIGAVDDPTDHSEPTSADIETLSASDLEFLAGGSALTPPAHVIAAAEAAEPVESKPRVAHIPGSAFAGLSVLASTRSIPEAKPKEYVDPANGLAVLERKGTGSKAERSARKDVHAVKVVTRLVRAIAFRPGSDAAARIKSDELARMLGEVTRAASAVAIAAAPLDAHRGWVQALCAEAMAELVASRAENDTIGEPLNIDEAVSVISGMFEASETKEMTAEAIAALMSDSAYTEATSEAIAADKVRVSIGLAAWDLYDNVMHPRLGVDAFRYTYGHKPEEIVSLLVDEAVRIAREMNIRTSSLDSRTMHLQGSIRRVAGLLGAEYVTRTRQIMNWIGADEDEKEYQRRCGEAEGSLKTVVIPQVVELARRNFIAIEQIAPQLLEDSKHAPANPQRET